MNEQLEIKQAFLKIKEGLETLVRLKDHLTDKDKFLQAAVIVKLMLNIEELAGVPDTKAPEPSEN